MANERGRIVVGVDGSPASHAALEWAVEEAKLRSCDVEAVHAWSPISFAPVTGMVPTPTLAPEDLEQEAVELLRTALASVGNPASAHAITAAGGVVEVLLSQSKGADLVVVGSRGRGGFTGLLLGSVSQQVAHHASCPVVIIREPEH